MPVSPVIVLGGFMFCFFCLILSVIAAYVKRRAGNTTSTSSTSTTRSPVTSSTTPLPGITTSTTTPAPTPAPLTLTDPKHLVANGWAMGVWGNYNTEYPVGSFHPWTAEEAQKWRLRSDGKLINGWNYCLADKDGRVVQSTTCDGTNGKQTWAMYADGLIKGLAGKCLAAVSYSGELQLLDCNSADVRQQWKWAD